MERKFSFAPGEYYHVYNRGTEKRDIFLDPVDYARFWVSLYTANSLESFHISANVHKKKDRLEALTELFKREREHPLVSIGAYCLMPNHFHMLIREKEEGGISRFMGKLLTGYSTYFNVKNNRTGRLFEGPVKARYVEDDNYLKYLFSYIHLNPIALISPLRKEHGIHDVEKAREFLADYTYSSYLDYIGVKRWANNILDREAFPEYFETAKDLESHISDWIIHEKSSA
jgi:putative transposase